MVGVVSGDLRGPFLRLTWDVGPKAGLLQVLLMPRKICEGRGREGWSRGVRLEMGFRVTETVLESDREAWAGRISWNTSTII